jgi:hypothetical protein
MYVAPAGMFARKGNHLGLSAVAYVAASIAFLARTPPLFAAISASFSNGPNPVMQALAETPLYDTHDNVDKRIGSFGTTFTNVTNTIIAYDGPYPFPTEPFPCNSRASVEINVAPSPADRSALSFQVQASIDASQIDTSKGAGFARVDFQILVELLKDAYISGTFDRVSSTNRGGIRILYGSYSMGGYQPAGTPVEFSEQGGSILRAGQYIIDVSLMANTIDPTPRQQNASASFDFSTVSLDSTPQPIPPPPSHPVGLGGRYVYLLRCFTRELTLLRIRIRSI